MTSTDTELSRLRWRCRRGTLELDLLFERFLAEAYPSLNPTERSIFDEFLNATDPLIMAWLAGRAKPAQPPATPAHHSEGFPRVQPRAARAFPANE